MSGPNFAGYWEGLKQIIANMALGPGGTISAAHGIGTLKFDQLAKSVQQTELELMQRIRTAVDPRWRMNPGVLF